MSIKKQKLSSSPADEKTISFKAPKKTWVLLKKEALMKDSTIASVIIDLVEKNRSKITSSFVSLEANESL